MESDSLRAGQMAHSSSWAISSNLPAWHDRGLPPIAATPRTREVLTPSQLNTLARDLLEGAFPLVWVEGELGNLSRPSSGHLYFTLKDARAQVRCALFKPKSQWLKFVPRDGLRVLARGRLTLYEARGDYQLILEHMEDAGEGALRRAFERTQGEARRRRPVRRRAQAPPARLCAPAWRDHLAQRRGGARRAQRAGAALPAARGRDRCRCRCRARPRRRRSRPMLRRADASGRYDAMLLARGGGSLEDLWAFNDEALARAIAASTGPGGVRDRPRDRFQPRRLRRRPARADAVGRGRTAGARWRTTCSHACARWMHGCATCSRSACARRCSAPIVPRCTCTRCGRRHACRCCGSASRRRCAAWCWRGGDNWNIAMPACAMPTRCCARCSHGGGWHACMSGWRRCVGRPQAALARRLQRDAMHLRGLARSLHAVSPLATVARGYAILQHDDGRIVRASVTRRSAMRSMRGWWMAGCACGWNRRRDLRLQGRSTTTRC